MNFWLAIGLITYGAVVFGLVYWLVLVICYRLERWGQEKKKRTERKSR